MISPSLAFRIRHWKPFEKNTLRAFFTLVLPDGMVLKECTLHERENTERWVGLPARPYTAADGQVVYESIIDFETRSARDQFQKLALAAVDALHQGGEQ